jgi:hypothetical protein
MEDFCISLDEKKYRAKQIFRWLYRGVANIDEMTDIPESMRTKIKDKAYIITTPKTKSSIRDVLLPNNMIDQLNSLKTYYKHFDEFCDTWFIFGGIIPLAETSIRRHKINACSKTKSKKEIRIFSAPDRSPLIYDSLNFSNNFSTSVSRDSCVLKNPSPIKKYTVMYI